MPCLLITSAIRIHVLPKHSIPTDRFEGDAHLVLSWPITIDLLTFQELAPLSLSNIRHLEPWELRPSTLTLRVDVDHKGAYSIGFIDSATPVIMVLVVTTNSIPLTSQSFNMKIWTPALEVSGTMFNTPDDIITVNECNLREPDSFLD